MAAKTMPKVLIVIAVLVVIIVIMVLCGLRLMKVRHGGKHEVLEGESGAPRALVVYQPSLTSAAGDVARWIAEGLNEGGYEVTLNRPGYHLSADISAYDVIVLGGPNYGSNFPEALFEYVDRIEDFGGKRVILFCTAGSSEGKTELEKLASHIRGAMPHAAVKLKFNESKENQIKAHALGLEAATEE